MVDLPERPAYQEADRLAGRDGPEQDRLPGPGADERPDEPIGLCGQPRLPGKIGDSRRGQAQAPGPASGTATWNVEPRPSALSTRIVPPCSSTICRTIGRPSPVPRIVSCRADSTRGVPFEDGLQRVGRDAQALDRGPRGRAGRPRPEPDHDLATVRRVLERVVQQVDDHLGQLVAVRRDGRQGRGQLRARTGGRGRSRPSAATSRRDDLADVDRLRAAATSSRTPSGPGPTARRSSCSGARPRG